MPPTARACLASALAALLAAVTLSARAADDADAVKERLFKAKKGYDAETQKFRKAVGDFLDKREDDARKAGNKKVVDQAKAERVAFEKAGDMPAALPPAVVKPMTAARAALDKAYTAAVKDYVKLKEDAAAEATEKEQQRFALDATLQFGKRTYLVTLPPSDIKTWKELFTTDGTQADKKEVKYTLNGELVPHSINIIPPPKGTAQVKYTPGGKATAFRVTVGVPKIEDAAKPPASALTFEVLGDGKSLWKSEPVTKLDDVQTCTVRVEKVKVLTLHVHCADRHEWARAVWFEPLLAE